MSRLSVCIIAGLQMLLQLKLPAFIAVVMPPIEGKVTENEESGNKALTLPPGPVPKRSLRQVFRDDFNSLDKTRWIPDATLSQGGHDEFEIYSPESANCYTRGGILYLRPTLTSDKFGEKFLHHGVLDVKQKWGYCYPTWNNGCHRDTSKDGIMPPIMSCMLRSKLSFKYGRLEIVARMPKGDWLWPALWLLPRQEHYGHWPGSGEIDLVEALGNINYGKLGLQRTTASLHFGDGRDHHKWIWGQHWLHGATYGDKFYKYVLDWTPDHLNMYVDDVMIYGIQTPSDGMQAHYEAGGNKIYGTSKNAPFDQDFYIIMNVAVGGTHAFWDPSVTNYPFPMPWRNQDSSRVAMEKFWTHKNEWYPTWHGENAAMKVDSVTLYSYN